MSARGVGERRPVAVVTAGTDLASASKQSSASVNAAESSATRAIVVRGQPEAFDLLSAELAEPVTFQVAAEHEFLERLIDAGVPAGTAELLIAREWSILAGENDYTTDTFERITGRPPRPVAEFLHEYRAEFV